MNGVSAQGLSTTCHQVGEEVKLGGRERNPFLVVGAGLRRRVHPERAVSEHIRRVRPVDPAQERLDPGQELIKGKRLGQIVVGPSTQPRHPVLHRIESREHHDGQIGLVKPQPLAHIDPRQVGQADVQENEVDALLLRIPQRPASFLHPPHVVALLIEALPDERRHVRLIFHEQKLCGGLHRSN